MNRSSIPLLALALAAAPILGGCVAAVVGAAAAGTAMVATDRRLTDVQIADERIELTTSTRIGDKYQDQAHVNVTSYNRTVLLTGEVPTEAAKADVEQIAAGVGEVRGVNNEVVVGPAASLGARSNDTYITSQVKSRLVTAKNVSTLNVKVVTETGVVYLMGLVTAKEADEATQIARTTSGVKRVVRVFEITPDPAPPLGAAAKPASTAPAAIPAAPPPPPPPPAPIESREIAPAKQ